MGAMSRIRRTVRGRRSDERGATLIFTAICMVALLGAGAMGVDVGFTVFGSRQAQAMADTAALDLARYVNIADSQSNNAQAQLYLNGKLANVGTDNGSNASMAVTLGVWTGTAWQNASRGCTPATPPLTYTCNAVKISATQTVPQIFFGGFNSLSGHSGATAGGASIAAVTPESAFSIGSFLASFNSQQSGVLNALLSTLGTSANVTAVGYQGLANTYVTINQLVTASGGLLTSSNVMTTSLTAAQWLAIWNDAVANQVGLLSCGSSPTPDPCNAATALGGLDFGSTSAQLCQLVSVDGSSCANGTLSTSALSTSLNALQLLTTEAELANGTSALDVTSALGITGVTSARLYLTLINPPQVAYGPVNTTASTAQLQADLQLSVLGAGLVDIPLSAASGTATLKTLKCSNNIMSTTQIAATTTTSTANVTLAGTGIGTLSLTGYSGSQVGYAAGVVPPTASTVAADTNPITVSSNTTSPYYPTPNWSGFSLGISNPAYPVVTGQLAGVLGPVLQAAGVAVGGAEVADLSTNCDAVSLVQ